MVFNGINCVAREQASHVLRNLVQTISISRTYSRRMWVWAAPDEQVRGLNRNAYAFLVGTKYDLYTTMPAEEQRDIDKQVRGRSATERPRSRSRSACWSCRVVSSRVVVALVEVSGTTRACLLQYFSRPACDPPPPVGGEPPRGGRAFDYQRLSLFSLASPDVF